VLVNIQNIKQANKLGLFDQNISTEHGRVVRDMVVDRACQRVWYYTRLRHAPPAVLAST
jgi:hypothetical protein